MVNGVGTNTLAGSKSQEVIGVSGHVLDLTCMPVILGRPKYLEIEGAAMIGWTSKMRRAYMIV
jgi:hypothetical protein